MSRSSPDQQPRLACVPALDVPPMKPRDPYFALGAWASTFQCDAVDDGSGLASSRDCGIQNVTESPWLRSVICVCLPFTRMNVFWSAGLLVNGVSGLPAGSSSCTVTPLELTLVTLAVNFA